MMDLPSGKPGRIGTGNIREYEPAWSPDGEWLAYVTWSSNAVASIWKWRTNGQFQPQAFTRVPGYFQNPAWSPDGTKIVALRASTQARVEALGGFGEQTGMDLVWIPKEGGEPTLIVPSRGVGKPHFASANDRVFVYSRQGLAIVPASTAPTAAPI